MDHYGSQCLSPVFCCRNDPLVLAEGGPHPPFALFHTSLHTQQKEGSKSSDASRYRFQSQEGPLQSGNLTSCIAQVRDSHAQTPVYLSSYIALIFMISEHLAIFRLHHALFPEKLPNWMLCLRCILL